MTTNPFLTRRTAGRQPVRRLLSAGERVAETITLLVTDVDGVEHKLDATAGQSVMEVARRHSVHGIEGACGGACVCATCHVSVAAAFWGRLSPMSDQEAALVAGLPEKRKTSRLSCQITMERRLHGLRVTAVGS